MNRIINKLFGLKYWYQVRYTYKRKDGYKVFDFQTKIGVLDRREIMGNRELKPSALGKLLHATRNLRPLLCNGRLFAEPVCYLGRFKDK